MPRLLAARPGRRLVLLARSPGAWKGARGPEVELVAGDVTRPDLGLLRRTRRRLRREVTEVVHAAATTRFDAPIAEARRTNVEGTRRLLAFARECDGSRFVFVSTVYVAGLRAGTISEEPLPRPAGFVNAYQESKHEAEALVQAAAADLPCCTLRMSTIAGDSVTGEVLQRNVCHHLIRLVARSPFPVAPVDPEARIDLLPTDWALDRLAALVDAPLPSGAVRHACAGRANSLAADELLEIARAGHRRRLAGVGEDLPPPPRFVPLDEWRSFVARETATADALTVAILRSLDRFVPHLALRQDFSTSLSDRDGPDATPFPPARVWFGRVVEACLSEGYGRRRSMASASAGRTSGGPERV